MFASLEQRAWHEAIVFVRRYDLSTAQDGTHPWVDGSMLEDGTRCLLGAYGYLEDSGSRIRPSMSAYEADFTDRMLPMIRACIDANHDEMQGTFVSGLDLVPLVSEGWLERTRDGYAVTARGKAALERAVSMHRFM